MKKTTLLLMMLLALPMGLMASTRTTNQQEQDAPFAETNIVEHPTKKQLTGVWQACVPGQDGSTRAIPVFKILSSDGSFMNLLPQNVKSLRFTFGTTGTWKVKGGCLVETVNKNCDNPFAGKSNPMSLTLSNGGKHMHIVWTAPGSNNQIHEYYTKVE